MPLRFPSINRTIAGVANIDFPFQSNLVCWFNPARGVTTSGAGNFVSASSQYLSIASNSTLQCGNIDFVVACWFKSSSASFQALVSKQTSATNHDEYGFYIGSTGYVSFNTSNASGQNNGATTATGYLDGNWHFVIAVQDIANNRLGISIDNGAFTYNARSFTPTTSATQFRIGEFADDSIKMNGQIDTVIIMKPPTAVASLISSITSTLYNSGNGLAAKDLSPLQKTQWGVISGWDMDGTNNLTKDYIGTNTLTNNNAVTLTTGKVNGNTSIDGDNVSGLKDLTINGNNATGVTGTYNLLSGVPAINNAFWVLANFSSGQTDFTLYCEFYATSTSQFSQFISIGDGFAHGYGITTGNGGCSPGSKLQVLKSGGTCDQGSSTVTYSANIWTSVAITRTAGVNTFLYKNGSNVFNSGVGNFATPITGGSCQINAGYFGNIYVYSVGLNDTQISQLHNLGVYQGY